MFNYPVVYVDIETTGGSYRTSRVLEVAAIRHENGTTKEFSTLINPQAHIPVAITRLTGITQADIADAPTFDQVADELLELCEDAIFVAHNVRFDYSFLKAEFARVGIEFSPRLFCTVRLSRALYAQHKGHSLAKLIDRHEIPVLDRHRALADARAIKYFTELAFDEHGQERFAEAVARQLKSQYLPPNLDMAELDGIGDLPGVYIFKDEHGQPLYVGKSVTLRSRILSHFRDTSSKELKISQQVHHVETIHTGSELGALVLESRLVKQLQPLFNRQLRRTSLYALLVKSEVASYATLEVRSGSIDPETDLSSVYGIYETRTKAKTRLLELTRTFQLCPKLMGIEKTAGACFSYQLGRCKGACVGKEAPSTYNRRFEVALEHSKVATWPFKSSVAVPVNQEGERVVIDNWIIRGFLNAEGEHIYEDQAPNFDVDEYKIIKRFLRSNLQVVQPFTES